MQIGNNSKRVKVIEEPEVKVEPTKFNGQAELVTNSQKGKAIQLIGTALTIWIPVTKEDAEQMGMEKEWKASAKAGRHFHWKLRLSKE